MPGRPQYGIQVGISSAALAVDHISLARRLGHRSASTNCQLHPQTHFLRSGHAWLQEGAHFYVCGDEARMAKDVDVALHQIVEKEGGLSLEGATAYVEALRKEKRYKRDVY